MFRISPKLPSFLVKAAFLLEPLVSLFISYSINRKLNEWKGRGFIENYKTDTKRLGKFHYKIDMDIDLGPKQLRQSVGKILKRVRR